MRPSGPKKPEKAKASSPSQASSRPLTVDDIRHKAEHVRDVAKDEIYRQTHEELARNLAIGVLTVALAVSLAFYLGSRSGRRRRRPLPPPG